MAIHYFLSNRDSAKLESGSSSCTLASFFHFSDSLFYISLNVSSCSEFGILPHFLGRTKGVFILSAGFKMILSAAYV